MSENPEVIGFLEKLDHPLKTEILEIRKLILASNEGVSEQVKWNAPSFCFAGDDRITFNLAGKNKNMFRLIFHRGAKPKKLNSSEKYIHSSSSLLEWPANDRAILTFKTAEEIQTHKPDLQKIVTAWLNAVAQEAQ